MKNTLKYFALASLLLVFCGVISDAQNSSESSANQVERNKVTEVALEFMKAYAKRDLAKADSLSAGNGEIKKRIRKPEWNDWQGRENLIFENFVARDGWINGNNASVWITFTLRETDADIGDVFNPISFDFALIKESGNWKVSDVGGSTRHMTEDLLAAKDDAGVLEIAKQGKILLNSTELDFVLDGLQNRTDVNRDKIIKIFNLLSAQIEQPKDKNSFLYKQGWLLSNSGKLEEAEKSFTESIALSLELKDDITQASSLISLSNIYLRRQMDDEAARVIEKGLAILLAKPNLINKQLTWIRFAANFYFNQKEYEQAKKYYEQGERLAAKANFVPWQAVFLKDLGDCGLYAEKYEEALPYYQKLVAILERPEEKEGFFHGNERINLSTIYPLLADTLEKIDRKSEAQSFFEKSCSLAQAGKSTQDLEYACNSLIEYYFRRNLDQKAVESFNKLSERLFELKAETELIELLDNFTTTLGVVKGKHNQAEKIADDWSEKISPENRIGIYKIQTALYLTNYKWSLVQKASQKIIDSKYATADEKLGAMIGMATTFSSQFQKDEALKWISKAEVLAAQSNVDDALTLVRLYKMLLTLSEDNPSQNIAQLQKIIDENPDSNYLTAFASYLIAMSYVSMAEDDYAANAELVKKSISLLEKSLDFYNRPQNQDIRPLSFQVYFSLALIYKETGDLPRALENIKKAKAVVAESGEMNFMEGQMDLFEAEIQSALGNYNKAKENFRNGLQGLDKQKKFVGGGIQGQLNFNSAYHSFFKGAVNAELQTGNTDNAVAVVDLAKGQMLRELTGRDEKPDWVFAEGVPKGVISTTVIKSSDAEDKKISPKSNLSVEKTAKQIQSLNLDEDTVVVNYFVDDEDKIIHLFVLSFEIKTTSQNNLKNDSAQKLSWRHYAVKYDYKVENKIKRFQNILRNNESDYRQLAKELYDLLLKPIDKQISGKSTLLIIPDSFLWQLPFEALISRDAASPTNAERDEFVIEKFAVQYEFSLMHLTESEQKKKARLEQSPKAGVKNVLAIGNSAFGGKEITLKPVPEIASPFEDKARTIELIIQNGIVRKVVPERKIRLQSLPGAAVEAKNLVNVYGASNLDYWIDENATKNKFIERASSYRIIHIATHGILDDENPLNSSLVFSDPALAEQNKPSGKYRKPIVGKETSKQNLYGENYLLTAQEILSELNLNADLVILSACDTANGDVSDGEGLVGLTWAFLGAGATDVLASRWKVDDGKTPELMKEFHQQLQDKKQNNSISTAWQKSVKNLLKDPDYYHPYYWAGFVSIGAR